MTMCREAEKGLGEQGDRLGILETKSEEISTTLTAKANSADHDATKVR